MDFDDYMRRVFEFPGQFVPVASDMTMSEKFNAIRSNYKRKQDMADAGLSEWYHDDPYEIADWQVLFTPIERALWHDIRSMGLDLWPQFPVSKYFVDFGNPVAKVAVECDGAEWHQDKAKDAARDAALVALGWRVYRLPGWECMGEKPRATLAEVKDRLDRKRPE